MKIKTEFDFILPRKDPFLIKGSDKEIAGIMRLAKIKDVLDVYKDVRVKKKPSYFYVILLSKVIKNLGNEKIVNNKIIENLSPENFAFLIDFFNEINHKIITQFPVECDGCGKRFIGEIIMVGEV